MRIKVQRSKFKVQSCKEKYIYPVVTSHFALFLDSGFTLVELLVVIAVLAFLSALLLPNFIGARQRGRDVQRKSDVKQIQNALELYKIDQNPQAYPTSLPVALCGMCWTSAGSATTCPSGNVYLRRVPCDPQSAVPTPYAFTLDSDPLKYSLSACLENAADSDRDETSVCSGGASYTLHEP